MFSSPGPSLTQSCTRVLTVTRTALQMYSSTHTTQCTCDWSRHRLEMGLTLRHRCAVVLCAGVGWLDACWNVLDCDGVHPLKVRRYRCCTHKRVFTPTDASFCSTAYGAGGFGWAELQPEPLLIKHGQTYMSAAFFWDVISMFERRVTFKQIKQIKQIIDIVQQRWPGIYAQNAA